jgi:hypothetical protein
MVLGGFGKLGNFPLQEVDLGHCVYGFRWFWGLEAIFLCRGLIWGTVWMVLGGFRGVRQFSFVGVDLGHFVDGFRWFLGC